MLIILAVHYLTIESVQALPNIPALDQTIPLACDDIHRCRTIGNILWSCLVTIFACTWIAIHPNIPSPDDKWFTLALRRLQFMVMGLIAPELVIVWAIRQWFVARKLAKKHHKMFQWTQTHGFFALMGGFMLFDGDDAVRTLDPDGLKTLSQQGEIDFPRITKDEIQDKSKGDILSKTLVMIQTGWFVLQCIARGVERLPITELEIVTLAFAALNLVTYGLWWHKPLNVQCSFRVPKKIAGGGRGEGAGEQENGDEFKSFAVLDTTIEMPDSSTAPCEIPTAHGHTTWGATTTICKMQRAIRVIGYEIMDVMMRAAHNVRRKGWDVLVGDGFLMLYSSFVHMMGVHGGEMEIGAKNVSTFYSGELEDSEEIWTILVAAATAMIFGAIHCVAWSFQFPSHTEQLLWRIASISISLFPVCLLFQLALEIWLSGLERSSWLRWVVGTVLYLVIIVGGGVLYSLSRIVLLVIAFTSVRSLPAGTYETVHWTTFIPHI